TYYPVYLDLRGRRTVVLGGGALAREKAEGLLRTQAKVVVVAKEVVPELAELADRGLLEWVARDYRPGDLAGAVLAIDASGQEAVNASAHAEARSAGVMINVVDRPEQCDWIAPAVVRRGPLQIAVSTSGESPFLAGSIRARLERLFGEEWGSFTALLGGVRRRLRSEGVELPAQEVIYRALLASEARALLRQGDEDQARFLAAAIAGHGRRGRVTLAGAGPGDPGLLTVAARDAIFEADAVFHDALVDPAVLALRGPHTRLLDVGKRGGRRGMDQEDVNRRLVAAAQAGEDVVRLKGGDPFVFGRGGEELEALLAAGVEARVIPGVSSATAGAALAGIPLTLRGVSSSVSFVTARTAAGPADLERLARSADTLVVLMAGAQLAETTAGLARVLGKGRPAALVARASLPGQQVIRADLGGLAGAVSAARPEPPALLVVGEVAAFMSAAGRPGDSALA
ncbi:MAG: uroporphyrinogen-III C-methyltransferase, partial [Candidatus Dormibacteraeota bacterium]|nr:uroporphyrinogen-III C-methyltransferase [Candidatus Dormibacteraeota bacterium]